MQNTAKKKIIIIKKFNFKFNKYAKKLNIPKIENPTTIVDV